MKDWVSVKDRLPQDGQLCVVASSYYKGGVAIQPYYESIPLWESHKVTHWIPLSEPPK